MEIESILVLHCINQSRCSQSVNKKTLLIFGFKKQITLKQLSHVASQNIGKFFLVSHSFLKLQHMRKSENISNIALGTVRQQLLISIFFDTAVQVRLINVHEVNPYHLFLLYFSTALLKEKEHKLLHPNISVFDVACKMVRFERRLQIFKR